MAAILEREQLLIKPTWYDTTIPNSPVAKLMYYFHCVCCCVADSDETPLFSDWERTRPTTLSSPVHAEESALLTLCLALSPDKLINSVFFLNEDINGVNKFFEVSAVSTKLLVSESLLIGGQRKRVQKIMMFKKEWIERYYLQPLKSFVESCQGSNRLLRQPDTSWCCCTILWFIIIDVPINYYTNTTLITV